MLQEQVRMLYMEKSMNEDVFRTYDIRGIVEKDFDSKLIY